MESFVPVQEERVFVRWKGGCRRFFKNRGKGFFEMEGRVTYFLEQGENMFFKGEGRGLKFFKTFF